MTTQAPPKEAFTFQTRQDAKSMFADTESVSDDKRPVRLTAFTGEEVNHWWWGRCIFDRSGFRPSGSQLTIDYNHNPNQEIGYIDGWNEGGCALICTGYLLPYPNDPADIASKIIYRAKRGRQYQCSVTVDEYFKTEHLEEDASAEVNGMTVKGPIRIFREYSIMGVAICPYATDKGTEAKIFNNKRGVTPDETESETNMSDKPKEPAAPVETGNSAAKTDDRALFKTFCKLYGNERAAKYFADGLTEGQAKDAYFSDIQDELEEKDKKIAELEEKIDELEKGDGEDKEHAAKIAALDKEHAAKIAALEAENAQIKSAAANFKGEEQPLSGNQQQASTVPKAFSPFSPEQQVYAQQIKQDMEASAARDAARNAKA